MDYVVSWEIQIDAESPEDAAEEARRIQLDPGSTALVFKVEDYATSTTWDVDLSDNTAEAE